MVTYSFLNKHSVAEKVTAQNYLSQGVYIPIFISTSYSSSSVFIEDGHFPVCESNDFSHSTNISQDIHQVDDSAVNSTKCIPSKPFVESVWELILSCTLKSVETENFRKDYLKSCHHLKNINNNCTTELPSTNLNKTPVYTTSSSSAFIYFSRISAICIPRSQKENVVSTSLSNFNLIKVTFKAESISFDN